MSRRRQFFVLAILLLALPAVGLGCQNRVAPQPVTLQYWRVFDGEDTMRDIIKNYRVRHPYVTIEYKKMRYEEYERLLLEAFAEDRGPDLFSIHNTWIGEYEGKLSPLPASTTTAELVAQAGFAKSERYEEQTRRSLTPTDVRQSFIDIVARDVVRTGSDGKETIYGVPLGVDTLVMFYNRDLLNNAGIATVPENWSTFLTAVSAITRLAADGQIVVAGASLGTATNVPRFTDLLAVLMMQNGAEMTDDNNFATFHLVPKKFPNRTFNPGIEALRFYTDFANPTKEAYTWNDTMPDGLEAFMAGRSAFFFGYSYHVATIRAQAPQLNWGIAPLPQADAANNRVNFANYWVEAVSKKSSNQEVAWDFIQYAARESNVKSYLAASGKPPALRSLIDADREDPLRGPFASQLLTATSWYRGRDIALAEEALADLVTMVVGGNVKNLNDLVAITVQRINRTIR